MKRISVGLIIFFAATVAIFRWAYSENSDVRNSGNASNAVAMSEGARVADQRSAKRHFVAEESRGAQRSDESASALSVDALRQQTRDIATCIRLQNQKRIASSLLAQSTNVPDEYTRNRLDQNLAMSDAQITKLQSEGACAGLDENTLKGAIYPLLLELAKKGDDEAADCYVAADFELSSDQLKPEQVEEYRRNAATLVQVQMEKGDWRMVELMETANDRDGDPHRGRYSWFREISAEQPQLAYGYNRLIRLGATDEYASNLDHALESRKAELNPAQIAEQDAWAEREYQAHFAHSSPIDSFIPTCSLYSDRRVFHNILRNR